MPTYEKIEGSVIRAELRKRGLPGGAEKICCGGRIQFSRDYETQLKRLGWVGSYIILEKGVLADKITIAPKP